MYVFYLSFPLTSYYFLSVKGKKGLFISTKAFFKIKIHLEELVLVDDVGEEAVLGGKLVESVIREASGAEEAVEDVLGVLASEVTLLVELGDDDLDSSVVTSLNESVGGRAIW